MTWSFDKVMGFLYAVLCIMCIIISFREPGVYNNFFLIGLVMFAIGMLYWIQHDIRMIQDKLKVEG